MCVFLRPFRLGRIHGIGSIIVKWLGAGTFSDEGVVLCSGTCNLLLSIGVIVLVKLTARERTADVSTCSCLCR